MEKIRIAQLSEYHGTTKAGKPYSKWNIVDGGNRKLGCFKGQWNAGWKVGDELDVEIVQEGQYLNIKAPPRPQDAASAANNEMLAVINTKLDKILSLLKTNPDLNDSNEPSDFPL